MDLFLTFTCNQSKNVGIKIFREWLVCQKWRKHFIGFESLFALEQNGIERALEQ